MKSNHGFSVIAAALVFSVPFARCQEVAPNLSTAGHIPNWPAPAYWSPPGRVMDSLGERGGIGVEESTSPLPFIGVTPCRLLDTRNDLNPLGGGGPFAADEIRTYTLPGSCGLPSGAQAVSLNVTVTNTGAGAFGHIKIWPFQQDEPNVSTLNYPGAGATVANAAIVPLSTFGLLNVKSGNASADVILDTNGYYGPGVGTANTFLGVNAGNFTTIGFGGNTGIGYSALNSNTTGGFNTAIGAVALQLNTTGLGNTAIGVGALSNNTSGNGNIAIGYGAGVAAGSDNIDIGSFGVADESATIRIGTSGTHTRAFLAGVRGVTTGAADGLTVLIDSSGQLGTISSSADVKREISDVGEASSALLKFRPVSFLYRNDTGGIRQYGLIAEEVARVMPELVQFSPKGRPEAVRYHFLAILLLNELQKEHRRNEEQESTIEKLLVRLDALEARVVAEGEAATK